MLPGDDADDCCASPSAYTLGAMYACQIFNAAEKDIPGLEKSISEGKFSDLKVTPPPPPTPLDE